MTTTFKYYKESYMLKNITVRKSLENRDTEDVPQKEKSYFFALFFLYCFEFCDFH